MKKKMIHLFLIIVCLGSLSLITGWYKYQKDNLHPKMDRAIAHASPQTMTQFLRSSF